MIYILKNNKELFTEYAVVCVQDFYSLVNNDCEYELSTTDNILDATTFRSIDKEFEIRELMCENPHDWEIVLFGEACGFKTLEEARD